ncbi:hypothetical protein, partial [Mesorhizobium sp.]|uniref:hypothetical protein n=1 Tax=Mesorhizobium sp. TaxID=1871066 RepID=UPI00258969B8
CLIDPTPASPWPKDKPNVVASHCQIQIPYIDQLSDQRVTKSGVGLSTDHVIRASKQQHMLGN